jgi:hypothetical protein
VASANDEQVDLTITGITQDESVDGEGDGNNCPDAEIEAAFQSDSAHW